MFNNEKERFALRKLTVGLTSVMIGVSLISIQNSEVKADTTGDKTVQKVAEKKTTDVLSQQEKVVQTVPAQNKTVETTENEKTSEMAPAQAKQVADAQDAGQIKTPRVDTPVADTKDATDTANQTGVSKQENTLNVKTNKIAMTTAMLNANKVDSTANVKNYTPDVTAWTGQVVSNKDIDGVTRTYYELTSYTPKDDNEKTAIIIPNQDDFIKAGVKVDYQTMIKVNVLRDLNNNLKPEEFHFSDTNGKKTKLMGIEEEFENSFTKQEVPYKYSGSLVFAGNTNLKAVTGNGLDTENIDSMYGLFANDTNLIDISGVSNWNTSNVTNLEMLFANDSSLANIDAVANWDTSKNTTLYEAFQYMQNLSSIEGLRKWDTHNVITLDYAFEDNYYAENGKNPYIGNPAFARYEYEIRNNRLQTHLTDYSPLSNWNTSNVISMHSAFFNNGVSDISFVRNWDTSKVKDFYAMFQNDNIVDISPIANWSFAGLAKPNDGFITTNPINSVFYGNLVSDLTPLKNVTFPPNTNIDDLFWGGYYNYVNTTRWSITNANFKTYSKHGLIVVPKGKMTSTYADLMNRMKGYPKDQLHSAPTGDFADDIWFTMDGYNGIQISNGMDFKAYPESQDNTNNGKLDFCMMPRAYESAETDPDRVKADVRNQILDIIHDKLTRYQQIYNLPTDKGIVPVTPLDQITDLVELSNAKFKVVNRTLPELDTNDAYALKTKNELHEHKNVNDNGGYDVDTWGTLDISKFTVAKDGTNLEITGYNGDSKNVIIPNIADFWIKGRDQGCLAVEISSDTMKKIAKNAVQIGLSKSNNEKVMAKDTDWYDAFGGGTNKPGEANNQNGGLYIYNPNLIKMDLHNLNTSHIVDMSGMFNGARNVTTLGDLSQWDTSHANDMEIMFQECNKISDLGNLDNWQTGNVTKMNYMFNNTHALTNLGDLSRWNTAKVTDMSWMFSNANKLTNIGNLNTWQTGSVTDMNTMFNDMYALTNLGDLSKWNTAKVTDMNCMFNNMYALTNLGDLSKWDTAKVTNMSWMFSRDKKLLNIGNLNTWQTGNVQNMRSMFNNCNVLTNIGDLSNWNTSKVTNMQFMFNACNLLNTVGNLSQWNTSNVTSMKSMFDECNSIINLGNLNKWDTHNVTNMAWMFGDMPALTNIGDISNWDVSNVVDMSVMFQNDSNLKNIGDLSQWNVSKTTDMSWMFKKCSSVTNLGDLDNWDTHNVTDMQWMFTNMDKLENIGDISNWDVSNVTNMSTMFQNDSQLTHIGDLSHWNTSKVTAMDYMFFKNTSLKDLNISNWNLSTITDRDSLKYFMYGDKNLTVIANNIKLPSWYNNELDNGDFFWSDHMAIITNTDLLLKTTEVEDSILDYFDNSKLWYMTDGRPIFYQSNGSNDVIAVLNKANEEYIANYIKKHPGYGMELADNVDKTDPISLANANFITIDVPLTITFVDKTDKDKTVPATLTISGQGTYALTVPTDYELVGTLPTMYYGQNYKVEVKHIVDHNTVNDNATRTFILHLPDKTTKTIVQTINLTRNQDYDRVIKKIIEQTPWTIVANTSNVTVDGKVDNSYKAFEENTDHIRFAPITLPKMLGYKPVISKNATNPAMLMISFVALPTVETKPQVPSAPTVINKNDKAKTDNSAVADKKQVDWHIDQKVDSKTSYTVTNDQIAIKLPKLPDQVLNIIKTSDYTLAFNYLRLNKTNDLIFSIKYNKHGYVLSVLGKHGEIVKMIKCKSYDDLVKILFKLNR